MKVYFTQADIDEFSKYRDDLAATIKKGDVSFAYKVFDRLLKRTDERIALVDEILKSDLDFTADETIVTDPKLTVYAKNDAEMRRQVAEADQVRSVDEEARQDRRQGSAR